MLQVHVMLPPGPAAPPAIQTVSWLVRPIEFMESCRRHLGDAFSVPFVGFKTPIVMLSDPEAIRAVYGGQRERPARRVASSPRP